MGLARVTASSDVLLRHLLSDARDQDWREVLAPFRAPSPAVSLHLAVLVEPYLSFLLSGTKTVESRFSAREIAPYRRVEKDDVILLKQASGPIVGAFNAAAVWYYELDPGSWAEVREFAAALCAHDGFWEAREAASFATLVRVDSVRPLPALSVPKRDRRGWVVLADRRQQERLL